MSEARLNWFQRVISAARGPRAPSAEERRKESLQKVFEKGIETGANWKFYQAAWPSRARQWWPKQLLDSKDEVDAWSREEVMSQSRRMRANLSFMTEAVGTLSTFSVGNAFAPQFRTGDSEWDEAASEFIQQWYNICDVRGLLDFPEALTLGSEAIDIDGDFGVYLTERSNSNYPALQFVRGHRIKSDPKGRESFQGVVLDSVGRHLAYQIEQDDGSFREVSARDFILVGDPLHFDGVRYMGAFANSIDLLEDMKELGISELIGAKDQNAMSIVEYNETGMPEPPLGNYFNDTTGQTKIAVPGQPGQTVSVPTALSMPGEHRYAKIGSKVELIQSARPGPAWHGLMEWLQRQGCASVKMPYEFVVNPEKLGGTAARGILEKAYRTIERRQKVEKKLARRLVIWRMAKAIKNKEFRPNPYFWRVGFQMPRRMTVDKGRDEAARQASYMVGTRTLDGYLAEENEDWVQHRAQKEVEARDKLRRAEGIFNSFKHLPGFTFSMAVELLEKWDSASTTAGAKGVAGGGGAGE